MPYILGISKVNGRPCPCRHSKSPSLGSGPVASRMTPTETLMMTDYQWLEWCQEALLGGMKEGGKKAMNMNKKTEVHQEPDESPSQFYKYVSKYVRPSTCAPLSTQRQLITRG
jgi:hypothetical protein